MAADVPNPEGRRQCAGEPLPSNHKRGYHASLFPREGNLHPDRARERRRPGALLSFNDSLAAFRFHLRIPMVTKLSEQYWRHWSHNSNPL